MFGKCGGGIGCKGWAFTVRAWKWQRCWCCGGAIKVEEVVV